jgi:O-antigen/teichoic acid export membrane protein
VIVPAHQAADELHACLAAIQNSRYRPHEIIVADDGSTDRTAEVARRAGAICVTVPGGPRGPAAARNEGARAATGDALMFVDADVAIHPDALGRIAAYFESDPDVAAVFGSYDDRPLHTSAVSLYRNLLHHFVHQHGRREAGTFWAGCGAVRSDVFRAAGGFDERFRQPSIEDIELGARLRRAGHRVWLCPDVLGRHMKRWTFSGVIRTDVFQRAIPWTRLILREGRVPSDLNTSAASRVSAVVAWLIVAAGAAAFVAPAALWIALASLATLVALNAPLYSFFARRGGPRFVPVAIGMHGLYLLYSSAVFLGLAAAAAVHGPTGWISRLSLRTPFGAYVTGAGAGLVAKALSLAASFGNLWLLTNILSKAEFAGYVFVVALLSWLAMTGTAGLDRTLVYRLSRDKAAPGELTGGSLVLAALMVVLPLSAVLAAAVATGLSASGLVRLPDIGFWLAVLAPLLVTTCFGRVFEAWFVARGRAEAAVIVPALGDVARVMALGLAFFLLPTRSGVVAAIVAAALVPVVVWLMLAPIDRLRRPVRLTRRDLTYGMQAMLAKATNEGAHQVDVIMIGILATAAATADYGIAARLAPVVGIGKELLSPVLTPRLARYSDAGARDTVVREYRQVQLVGLVTALALAALFAAFGRALLGLFDGYESSYPLLLILAAGYVINAGFGSNAAFLTIRGHTGWTLTARIALLAGIVALNLTLIPALGGVGAALSLALGMAAVNGLMALIIWRVDRLPTMSSGLLLLLGAAFALLLLGGLELVSGLMVMGGLAVLAAMLVTAELSLWLSTARQLFVRRPSAQTVD